MKYYIDYKKMTGEILGFLTDATVNQKKGEILQVEFLKYKDAMAFNKIIVDGKNITFEKVNWQTPEEIEDLRIDQINSKQDEIITKKSMYPIYKQFNIDNQLEPYIFEDKEIKNMFILTVRLIGRQAKENGTFVDEIDWAGLDKIESPSSIKFEDIKAIKTRVLEELENAN